MRCCILGLASALALTCASCGKPAVYPVSGKVLYEGVPAAGAIVFFQGRRADPVNEHLIMGIVQNDGSFEVVCGPLGKGAPPGEYDVLIEWKQSSGRTAKSLRLPDKLKGRYADPRRPLLQATVAARNNVLPAFELTKARP